MIAKIYSICNSKSPRFNPLSNSAKTTDLVGKTPPDYFNSVQYDNIMLEFVYFDFVCVSL